MDKEQILALYPEFKSVYGPYKRKEDGRQILIFYDGKKRSARQYAKVLLEIKIGRRLTEDETVDHKDDNSSNDDPNNLQILTRLENVFKSVIRIAPVIGKCVYCEKEFQLSRAQYESRVKQKAGPFCSRSCSGKYGVQIQWGGEKQKRVVYEKRYIKGSSTLPTTDAD